ncbi:uncharacterized protein N7482_007166 [Penicillium canariense]|uniref:Uncharacterized protein n=1 Tax=Penicillium canariense TaxID=189055 RepID=A0A9W9HW98_9EURO|nr:uncharacterized protein N7482_007166 [Penicillium canariense]KAJ5160162.1 hypothetical protein N7482_007166 [Penicillium canariense]
MAGNIPRRGAIRENTDEIADEELNTHAGRKEQSPDSQIRISLRDNAQSLQIGQNYGTVNFGPPASLFDTLYQQASDNRSYYKPYTKVINRNIKKHLLYIADRFNFLDCGFAEYFQSVVPSFDRDYVEQRLTHIREDITKRQSPNPASVENPETAYLGDLGAFCEALSKTWNYDANQDPPRLLSPVFNSTHRQNQEIFEYLQDAFETHYWELMLDIFMQWHRNTKSLSGEIVLKVLRSLEREIRSGRNQLLRDMKAQSEDSPEDLAPIMQGIDERIAILESVGDLGNNPQLEMQGLLTLPVSQPHSSQSTSPGEPLVAGTSAGLMKEKENVGLIALILIFLIAAVVPGYKAFSISMKSSAPGSFHDAEFMYLIQSSLMSVLGNLVMVIPLLKKSLFSPAYGTMWMFFTLGLLFAIISIVIYPFINTGWSSMVAFFSSIASVASVLVMTQDAARDGPQKEKKD